MRTVADPAVRDALIARLGTVRPDSARRWGTLTAHEMLCHLGDAAEMVLGIRPRTRPVPARRPAGPVKRWSCGGECRLAASGPSDEVEPWG